MEENIISDENLKKYFTEDNLEEMALLFSTGNFNELINKFFYYSPRSESTSSSHLSDKNSNDVAQTDSQNQNATPQNTNTSNNNNNSSQSQNNNITSFSITQSPIPSISQKNMEFNYNLFEKLNEDELCQQILLTIALFCLLKKKNNSEEAKNLINKYNYPHYDMIFPLILLKAKFFIKSQNIQKAIDVLNDAIYLYEDYQLHLEEKKNDIKNIYTIETFHQKFKYFHNLFNYLFCMDKLDAKIKKLYFELKICLTSLKFYSQAYKTILDLYQKYPDDIVIQFELAKDSVIFSKPDKFHEILDEMKKNRDSQTDEHKIQVYNNYILYAEGLEFLAKYQYDECKNKFEEILKNDENNTLIKNNIAILSFYNNNTKDCYEKLLNIYKNESAHENIKETLKYLQDKFSIKLK